MPNQNSSNAAAKPTNHLRPSQRSQPPSNSSQRPYPFRDPNYNQRPYPPHDGIPKGVYIVRDENDEHWKARVISGADPSLARLPAVTAMVKWLNDDDERNGMPVWKPCHTGWAFLKVGCFCVFSVWLVGCCGSGGIGNCWVYNRFLCDICAC